MTRLVRLGEDGAIAAYPYSLAQLRLDHPAVSFPDAIRAETLAEYGAFAVVLVSPPSPSPLQRVVEADPEFVGGRWQQSWTLENLPVDEARAALAARVKALQAELFAQGWEHDFGEAGVHRLDLRTADDKANWTLLLIKTQAMLVAGGGELPVTLRTRDNATITIPASEAHAAMTSFLAWGEAMLTAKWSLDAAIGAAADMAELAAIDFEEGWPS